MGVAAHYLQIVDQHGGEIRGESEGHERDDWIDITGWDWDVADESQKKSGTAKESPARGATSGAARASAGGGEVGIQPSLFTFTKSVDSATTRLLLAMDEGHLLQMATITLLEELLDVNRKYREAFRLDIVLEQVKVVSYRLSVRASEHRVDLEETWGLNYKTIKFDYVSEGGMNATFTRPPGSEKGGATKTAPDPAMQQREISELKKSLAAAGKGTRG